MFATMPGHIPVILKIKRNLVKMYEASILRLGAHPGIFPRGETKNTRLVYPLKQLLSTKDIQGGRAIRSRLFFGGGNLCNSPGCPGTCSVG